MAERTAIIFNARSGSAPRERELRRLLEAQGIRATTHRIPGSGAVAQWLKELARDYDVLVAAGGDGTVSTVATAAIELGKVMGVIPTGTLNHFARDAGIPTNCEAAARLLAAGYSRALDVGTVNGVVFVNNASIGAYPHLVWQRNRTLRKGWPRRIAMSSAFVRTWIQLHTVTVHLRVDAAEVVRRSPFVFVGNSAYQVEGINVGTRPMLTDGRLSLYVAPDSGRLDLLMLPVRALLGTLSSHDKFETWRASTISMEFATRHVRVALDGEIHVLESPLRFSIRHTALRVITPAPEVSAQ